MACSKYEYVKKFEQHQTILPDTYIVVRVDGKGFTKFCQSHNFAKPNDIKALTVMNKSAEEVMKTYPEIMLAYGQSDEYTFVFNKTAQLYQRRVEKIVSCVTSTFSSAYTFYFIQIMPGKELKTIPTFDGRCVCYPNFKVLKDYLTWRQVDCHINNLYNTCFWVCQQKGKMSATEAEKKIRYTDSAQKNEIMFSEFGLNYNEEPEIFKKGTILIRGYDFPKKVQLNQSEEKNLESVLNSNQKDQFLEKKQLEIKQKQEKKAELESDSKQVNESSKKLEKNDNKKNKQKEKLATEKYYIDKDGVKIKKKQIIIELHQSLIEQEFWIKYKSDLKLQEILY